MCWVPFVLVLIKAPTCTYKENMKQETGSTKFNGVVQLHVQFALCNMSIQIDLSFLQNLGLPISLQLNSHMYM